MMDFGELRSLLHATPSEEAWASICEHFANVREEPMISQALDYALPHLKNHWPSNLRVLPEPWYRALTLKKYPNIESFDHPHTRRLFELAATIDTSGYRGAQAGELGRLVTTYELTWVERLVAPRGVMSVSDLGAIGAMLSGGGLRHLELDEIDALIGPQIGALAIEDWLGVTRPARFEQLRSLSLTRSGLTNSALARLLAVKQYFGLTALDLSYNAIDDGIAQHVVNAPLSKGLKHLILHGNALSSRGIEAIISALPQLRTLGVRGISLTEEVEESLRARGVQVVREDPGVVMRARATDAHGIEREKILYGHRITIGRMLDNEIVLPFDSVSRRHAEVWCEDGEVWARDFGSSGGTFVNDEKIGGARRLSPDDRLHLGRITIRFERIEGVD